VAAPGASGEDAPERTALIIERESIFQMCSKR
jgi:hypothetical protein